VENGAVRLFYPHGLTHMLGLDVHDVTGGRRRRIPNPTNIPVRFVADLEPGFVITMEPGIYFIAALLNDPRLRRKFRGSVDFKAADAFLGWLMSRKPREGFLPHARALNRLRRAPRSRKVGQ